MIDTHIHLEFKDYNVDREQVIKRFFDSGGKAIINIGTGKKRIKKTLDIANSHSKIYAAVGFHPQEAHELKNQGDFSKQMKYLRDVINNNQAKVVAIGEIGLDYFHASSADYSLKINDQIKEAQKEVFISQLALAEELALPVIIHSWDSSDDCWKILEKYTKLKAVFHCYGRGIPIERTKELLGRENIYFSFTGNVTYPRPGRSGSEIFEHFKLIPLERVMVETDGPFLAPVPFRGRRNEPAYVRHIIQKIAEIKRLDVEKVEAQTDKNAINFFGLKSGKVS